MQDHSSVDVGPAPRLVNVVQDAQLVCIVYAAKPSSRVSIIDLEEAAVLKVFIAVVLLPDSTGACLRKE